jgi:CHAT domain-containing protein
MARLRELQGRKAESERLHVEAVRVLEAAPQMVRELASLYNDFGVFYLNDGRIEEARPWFERGLAITTPKLAPSNPIVVLLTSNLARVQMWTGPLDEAERTLRSAIARIEERLGTDHPALAWPLRDLAVVLARTERADSALSLSVRTEELRRSQLRLAATIVPERQALLYAPLRPQGLSVALPILAAGKELGRAEVVWDAVIRSRGLVLDRIAWRRAAERAARTDEEKRILENWREKVRDYSDLLVSAPSASAISVERMAAARRAAETAEPALSPSSSAASIREPGLEDVRKALPEGSALLAYVHYQDAPARYSPRTETTGTDPRAYLAFVLAPGTSQPAVVPLGDAARIDNLVARWVVEASQPPSDDPDDGRRHDETSYRRAGEALRRAVFDPVLSRLRGARRVFVVLDGSLALVSLGALPSSGRAYLVERGPLFHVLSTERDLVRGPEEAPRSRSIVAFGAVDYGPPEPRPLNDSCLERARSFRPLLGSEQEVDAVAGTVADASSPDHPWSVLLRKGRDATEAQLKTLSTGASIVHLSTHATFPRLDCAGEADGIASLAFLERWSQEPRFLGSEPNEAPGLAGLAFAFANTGAPSTSDEDGVLTTLEAASLDLGAAEWVVLSACETAAGEIAPSEGVAGFRRAFLVAGARTVIASLWRVQDEPTRAWMKALYEARFRDGLPTDQALRQAMLVILKERRAERRSTHPFYWGAFLAVGDWK